jgi:hypothetical protein
MAETPLEIPQPLLRTAESHAVYVRRFWSDQWRIEPHLFCNHFNFAASPTISSAEFEWRYGLGRRQFDAEFAQVDYIDLMNWWVKVVVAPAEGDPLIWVGLLVEDHDSPAGALGGKPAGVQKLLAYGPEILLERKIIADSIYLDGSNIKRIRRGLTFNDANRVRPSGGVDKKKHEDRIGNRSASIGPGGTYLFAGDPDTAGKWSSLNIADYLLGYQIPRNEEWVQIVPIFFDGYSSEKYLPDWDKPVIAQHGRTLRDVLNELMDRRRMLGYVVRYELDDEAPEIDYFELYPFSYTDAPIDLGDGKVFAANESQVSLDIDNAVDLSECHIKDSDAHHYDQVVAAGARIICCGTLGGKNLTLAKHWTSAQALAYNDGASRAADYADLEQFDKDDRDKAVRAAEELRRVYSYFGLPSAWDGTVGDGETIESIVPLFAEELYEFEEIDSPWWPGELRFLPTLPLKSDHDYGGTKIAEDAVADHTPPGMAWHYREPLALLKLPPGPDGTPRSGGTRYADATTLGHGAAAEVYGDGAGVDFSCSLQVQPDGPGVILRVLGGVGQHELAGAEFEPIEDRTDLTGTFDWTDNLIITFAMEADVHCEARWPAALPAGLDAAKVLRIDATRVPAAADSAPGLHYVAPGTVVGLDDGMLVRTTGGVIRDDRGLLQRIARAAYEWYGKKRQAMTLTYDRVCNQFAIGQLITHVGKEETWEPVRSVVTEIRVDLAQSDGEKHRTTIQTQWAELDVLKLF